MSSSIPISAQCSVVIRKAAMKAKGIPEADILAVMESKLPDAANEDLLAFGPSFGEEAMNEFVRRLQALGLQYVDDFFCINFDIPNWCGLRCEVV